MRNSRFHFMDKTSPGKEASEEVTRESLIAISYLCPDEIVAPILYENSNSEKPGEGEDYDGAEKYRAELISISDSLSPETQILPVPLGGELNG